MADWSAARVCNAAFANTDGMPQAGGIGTPDNGHSLRLKLTKYPLPVRPQ